MNKKTFRLAPLSLLAILCVACVTPPPSPYSGSSQEPSSQPSASASSSEPAPASSTSSQETPVPSSSSEEAPEAQCVALKIKSPGTPVFYIGEPFNAAGLKVEGTFEDGTVSPIPNEKLVFSGINMGKEGMYDVKVSYQAASATYPVRVYRISDVKIVAERFEDHTDTKGLDASQHTHIPTVAFLNGELDLGNLVIEASSRCTTEVEPVPLIFNPFNDHVTIVNFDKNTLGPQKPIIRFECGDAKAEYQFNVNVTNALPYINRSGKGRFIECRIDPNFAGAAGEINEGTHTLDGSEKSFHHVFSSITEALDFLGRFTLDPDVVKRIYLADGTYNEKIDITLPHTEIYGNLNDPHKVTIQGSDVIGSRPYLEKANQSYVVAIRETANDCYLKNLHIIHTASQDPSKDVAGVALIAQADHFISEGNTIAGLDQAIILGRDRYYFHGTDITGRSKMVDDAASGIVRFKDCVFHSLPTIKQERDVMFDFPNASGGGYRGAAIVGARFESVQFLKDDRTIDDTYAIMAVSSPYVSIELHGVTEAKSHLGNSRETQFLYGNLNPDLETIKIRSKGTIRHVEYPKTPDNPINLWSVGNGRGHFAEKWDGEPSAPYASNDHLYVAFDGFHHTGDGLQTVISHTLNLEASEEKVDVNSVLSLYPIGGIHYDEEKHATFLGKGSKFTIKAQAGSILYAQTILPQETQFYCTGLGMLDEADPDNVTYNRINRPVYTYRCVGNVGEIKDYVFEALGDCYVKLITIVPEAMEMTYWNSGKYEYRAKPTDFFLRNLNFRFTYSEKLYYHTIFDNLMNNFCLQFDDDGYCAVINTQKGYHKSRCRMTVWAGGRFPIDTDTDDDVDWLWAEKFSYINSIRDYYYYEGYGDSGWNGIDIFYMYDKKEYDDEEARSDYLDGDYDCFEPYEYQFFFDIADKPSYEQNYYDNQDCSRGKQTLSWASTYDGDIPDASFLGSDRASTAFDPAEWSGNYRYNHAAGLVRTPEGGRAYNDQTSGGLALQGSAYLNCYVGADYDNEQKVTFKVAKGHRLQVEVLGGQEPMSFVLDAPAANSGAEYDYLPFPLEHSWAIDSQGRNYRFNVRPVDGGSLTLLSYDITSKE